MSPRQPFIRTLRTAHLYLGVFIAPMLLFFAITGGLQTFGLHERGRGSDYRPPAWLVTLAQLHKKQTIVISPRRTRPAEASRSGIEAAAAQATAAAQPAVRKVEPPRSGKNLWPMKIFFALVALGLLTSVLSGLYMAWRFSRKPLMFTATLSAGVIVPLVLLLF